MFDSEDTSGEQEATTLYEDAASSGNQDDQWWLPSAWEQATSDAAAANVADQEAVDKVTEDLLAGLESYTPPASSNSGFGGVGTDPSVAGLNLTAAEKAALPAASQNIGAQALKAITDRYTTGNVTDWLKVGKDVLTAGVAYNAYQKAAAGTPKTGYQGGIPTYQAVRSQLDAPNTAGARPGAGGQRYFTDTTYNTASGLPAAQTANAAQKTALEAQNAARQQTQMAQAPAQLTPEQQQAAADKFYGRVPFTPQAPATPAATDASGSAGAAVTPATFAHGGLMELARGGSTTRPEGTYLRGNTDGMADKLHATIDGNQPARLAHGEFIVPADVVSHLGNGNSDAGAKQLYKMMDRIRQARTGNKKQGKEINPDKFTLGGIAGYAAGGSIQHYVAGGTTTNTPGADSGVTGTESNLSNWAGPYVTDMLGKGKTLSESPYQAYQGPLTAGESALQTQAFGNLGQFAVPTGIGAAANTAGGIAAAPQTSSFNAPGVASSYMSPYQQNVVDVQQREAQRMADIATTGRRGEQVKQGAYGGSRGAVMDAEAARNLAIQQGGIQATGLQNAYTAGQQQFNTEQASGMAGKTLNLNAANIQGQLGGLQAQTGLAGLSAQLGAGAQQRDITSQGVAADKTAFEAERDNPYKMVQYQQSLLTGLPLAAQSYSITNNPISAAANAVSGLNTGLGILSGTPAPLYNAQTGAKL